MVIIIIFILFGILVLSVCNNTIYCLIYHRKSVKLANSLLKLDISEFEFKHCIYLYTHIKCKKFPNYDICLNENTKLCVIFDINNNDCSCIFSGFYTKGSRKLYKKLKNLKNNILWT